MFTEGTIIPECNKKQKNDENQASVSSELAKGDENAEEKSEFHKLASERVFLSDCLACDKCVTDEESQHIYQQNERELFNILSLNKKCDTSKHKVLAASLCPQSLPYFAAKFKVGIAEAARKLCGFLKCLGWIRYAERILGNLVTPHICTSKSPPQIMGSLVKDFFAKQQAWLVLLQNLPPDKVYHLVVAPCFDKKLEALREEFYKSLLHTKDVDCVLTSGEIIQIMEKRNTSVEELDSVALDHIFGEEGELDIARHEGRGSEGFLEHIFKFSAKELFGLEVEEIVYRTLKNRDFQEVILEKDGEVLLQFAAVYGFRNIQNMIQKLKKGKFPYQLVEVLACSGGCLSGKGQAQSTNGKPDKALLQQMDEVYTSLPVRLPEKNATVQKLYQDWLEGIDSQKAQEALHTQYRAENLTSSTLDYKW
ncbi:NARF factor, partial [Polypterus senegalus]